MRGLFILVRIAGAVAIVAAIVGQFMTSQAFWAANDVSETVTPTIDFFSFFTILSNVLAVVVFVIGAILLIRSRETEPEWFGVGRASVTAYMATTGIVYNMLLRGVELPQGQTLAWSNEVLHVVAPILLVLDWVFAPGRRRLEVKHIWIVVIFPIVWAVYTMIRGPFVIDPVQQALNPEYVQGWYPYPFLDPANSDLGYVSVAFYVVLIAAIIGGVGAAIVWVSRRRERWPLPTPKP